MIADRPKRTIRDMFPPFPVELRVAMETIPPAKIRMPHMNPIDPDVPPLSSIVFTTPAAHD